MIRYTEIKEFTKEQVEELYLSVGWVSGKYPERLYKALMNSETVITAWDEEKLVGLVRVIDDSEIEKYKDYLYIEIMPEESKNQAFYEKFGFKKMEDGVAMQICHY